uniref:Uncharacterized protein n=1 Tax=Anguilla anguilla TaxID=7936 RepID=A0A0E9T1G7_ANGAN
MCQLARPISCSPLLRSSSVFCSSVYVLLYLAL